MMDIKVKELVAISASVSVNCHPCFKFHVNKALENGVSENEIQEAVSIGIMVRKGVADEMDKLISALIK
ncbi:MAG: carboxymuconolactone decarboxylase family protein [Phycisphaerae bacterium]|nr:carboxymuconolactone decarboxylase family protein [Phycisphaerae bacterium]NIR62444.1 carboxymuconolactone decarboxylase family protein [candidate division Zixibacteria bacterium]NIP55813.1 carboxymuconolactone decarboxylase family protein [Phycisphaerae bacterium]NIS50301.1 carboxymuconolactone decarboxylase family protein [Phycisphaerae bacterium]NIU08046.1 carboxymuconolactone decarboxylase family protein [Phycisphaerae bacterium]